MDSNSFKLTKSGVNVVISSPIEFILDAAVCKLLGVPINTKSISEGSEFQTANVKHFVTVIPKLRADDVK